MNLAPRSRPRGYKMARLGIEQVLSGHKTRWRYHEDGLGAKFVTPVCVKKASSSENGGSSNEDGADTIELRIFEGTLFRGVLGDTRVHNASAPESDGG